MTGRLPGGLAFRAGLALIVIAGSALSCRSASAAREDAPAAPGAASPTAPAPPRLSRGRVVVPGGRAFAVEVVQDPESRARGLQRRPRLDPDAGMVFVFPAPSPHKFWMYDCLIPLDIIWIDASKTVIHMEEKLPICARLPCPDYGPDADALYVLELGAGVARGAGITPGTRLTMLFDQPPNPR